MHKHDPLKNLIQDHKLDILLIQESKMQVDKLEYLKNYFFKDCGFHRVNCEGASGGLATFWNSRVMKGILVVNYFNHLDTQFFHLRDNTS